MALGNWIWAALWLKKGEMQLFLLELRDSEEATKQIQTRIAQWNKNNDKTKRSKEEQQHIKNMQKNSKQKHAMVQNMEPKTEIVVELCGVPWSHRGDRVFPKTCALLRRQHFRDNTPGESRGFAADLFGL